MYRSALPIMSPAAEQACKLQPLVSSTKLHDCICLVREAQRHWHMTGGSLSQYLIFHHLIRPKCFELGQPSVAGAYLSRLKYGLIAVRFLNRKEGEQFSQERKREIER